MDATRLYLRRLGKEKAAQRRSEEEAIRRRVADLQHEAEVQPGQQPSSDNVLQELSEELKNLKSTRPEGGTAGQKSSGQRRGICRVNSSSALSNRIVEGTPYLCYLMRRNGCTAHTRSFQS